MPIDSYGREYATEEEVLEFANKLRAAGDAAPLESLMPSRRSAPTACLIANAVNFQSSVWPLDDVWVMQFPDNMDKDRIQEIADSIECGIVPVVGTDKYDPSRDYFERVKWVIELPHRIGNVAAAFDNYEGWTTKYVQTEWN